MDKFIQIISLLILVLFFSCYSLKAIFLKRKGIRTDHLGEGKEGFVRFIEIGLKIITIIVPLADVFFIVSNVYHFNSYIRIIGLLLAASGTIIFILSVIQMKDSWRAGVSLFEKTELVTGGVYSISRNPAFLGFNMLFIGILISFFNWYLYVLSLMAAIMFHLQIVNVEEDYLIATFKNEYTDYMKQVNRYIGRKQKQ